MLNLVKTISTELDSLNRRVVKFLRFGKSDVQTSLQSAPPGVDANPIKDMVAIYASTEEKGKTVIVGYINKNQVTKPGEHKIFSMNNEGDEETYIYLKDDGTMELGGASDNMVRYIPLNSGIQSFKTAIQVELTLIATGIAAAGGSYTPGVLNVDVSDSKIDEIKTL